MLGVEEEPHLVTVLMEKMSAVKQLQTLSEDMSGWLSGSKQGIALVCVLVMCLYYWSLGAADTQFTEKQAYYERIGEITMLTRVQCCEEDLKTANECENCVIQVFTILIRPSFQY